ncbi:MAG: RDD family protein [Lysinibacillus sp.]
MTEQVIFTNPTHERTVAEYVTYSHKEAGFWMRFWAFLIDTLLVSAVIGICVNPLFYLFDWDLGATNWYAPIVIISGVIYYTYFILMTKFFAQTVGKMIFGLKVRTDSGEPLDWSTVVFREGVGRFISNTFMKLPYLIVVFTPQHKAVHDYAADTFVVHEESYKETRTKRYVDEDVIEVSAAPNNTALVEPVDEGQATEHGRVELEQPVERTDVATETSETVEKREDEK